MGNLICCCGVNNNKRGGTNVKSLLQKTEKPGRRRRIDDLARDALKKEEREDRQNRKREKRGTGRLDQEHEHPADNNVTESAEEQNEKKAGVANEENEGNPSDESARTRQFNNEHKDSKREEDDLVKSQTEVEGDKQLPDVSIGQIESSRKGLEEDIEGRALEIDTPLVDGAEHSFQIKAEICDDSETNTIQMSSTGTEDKFDAEEHTPIDKRPGSVIESCRDSKLKVEVDSTHTTDEPNYDTKLQQDRDVRNTEESETESASTKCEVGDKLSDISDESEWDFDEVYADLISEIPDGSCEQNDDCRIREEWKSKDVYNGENESEDTITRKAEKLHDENKNVDTLHDTNHLSRCDEDVTVTHNDDSVHVLNVRDTERRPGHDNTEFRHTSKKEEECLRSNEEIAAKTIFRAKSLYSKQLESQIEMKNMKEFPSVSGIKEMGPNKTDPFPNTRSIVYNNKIILQKKLLGQSVTKYGGMDSMMIGGQKPQLREIQRLKQDSFDFPPKFRQHTEQDRRGSIADLKWSRHMKPKVRKNKRMSKFELEEILRGRYGLRNSANRYSTIFRLHTPHEHDEYLDQTALLHRLIITRGQKKEKRLVQNILEDSLRC